VIFTGRPIFLIKIMKKHILTFAVSLFSLTAIAQIGTIKTEQYRASFEKTASMDTLPEYHGTPIPIQLLNIGVTPELFESYPELKDKRVGLGLTNIVVEYLEFTDRFIFTESSTEIKNRMVKQFQASQAGISQDTLNGRGKIRLAHYFVYIEVYDFSVSEDETIKLKDGVKNVLTTRLGLQVKFVDAETGAFFTSSGLGEASTVREMTLLNDENLSEVKFNQSTIGITTKKALESACSKIVTRMIKKQIFTH
jgi:hypothetical protein